MDGDWNTVQSTLRAERARPAYKLGVRYEQPGIFYLGFVLRSTPARENFSVLPSGYYYRKKVIRQLRLCSLKSYLHTTYRLSFGLQTLIVMDLMPQGKDFHQPDFH